MTNLEQMRETHRTTYQKFLARYDLVTSVNFSISWTPNGFSVDTGYLWATAAKTPFECIVGIRASRDKNSHFSTPYIFNNQKNIFEEVSLSKITDQENAILEIVESFLTENKLPHIEIGILSEVPRGRGFGFSGSMAAALGAVLFVYAKRCTSEEFKKPDFGNSRLHQEIFDFAHKITLRLRYNNAIGSNIAVGLAPGNFFLTQTDNPTTNLQSTDTGSSRVSTKSFHESFGGMRSDSTIPADYGVIFSGLYTDTKAIEIHKKSDETYLDKFSDFLKENFSKTGEPSSLFSKLSSTGSFHSIFSDTLSALSIEMVYFLQKLLEKGFEESVLDRLIHVTNHHRNVLSMMTQSERFPDRFRATFLSESQYPNADIGIFPLYGGKMGGGYLFIMKSQVNRETLENTISKMKLQYPSVNIEYTNYLHGESSSPVCLRQNLQDGYIAKELKGSGGFLYSNNFGDFHVASLGKILDEKKDDILFNEATGEIYIQGNPVDSKQLKSQNATIDLFMILLSKGSISNRELSVSSYSKNRSEMQSKILGPLSKIVEELLGKRLPIVCTGSILDFRVELESSDIHIGVIKKLGK